MNQGERFLPDNEDLTKAKNEIDGIKFILQQNSSVFLNNGNLSDEMMQNLFDLVDSIAKKIGLTFASYSTNSNKYSEMGVIGVALYSAFLQKNNQIKKAKILAPLEHDELEQLRTNYDTLSRDYDKVVKNAKTFSENTPSAAEYVKMKQSLEDAEQRLKIQNAASNEVKETLQKQIETEKKNNEKLEKEIESVQAELMRLKRAIHNEYTELGKSIGFDAASTDEIINFGGDNEALSVNTINSRIIDSLNKYQNLLKSFNVKPNEKNPHDIIETTVRNQVMSHTMNDLKKKYGNVIKGDLDSTMNSLINGNRAILRRIITTFNMPQNISDDDIVECLKEKFAQRMRISEISLRRRMRLELFECESLDIEQVVNEEKISTESIQSSPVKTREVTAPLQSEIEELKQRIKALEKEKGKLQSRNKSASKSFAEKESVFSSKLEQLADVANDLADKLQKKKRENNELKNMQESMRKEISSLKKKLAAEREANSQLEEDMNQQITQIINENETLKRELQNTQMQKSLTSELVSNEANANQENEKKIQEVVNVLMKRYNEQCQELQDQAKIKASLVEIVKKQEMLLQETENVYKRKLEEKDDELAKSKLLEEAHKNEESVHVDSIIDNLEFESTETLSKCQEIARNKDKKQEEKIKDICSLLMNEILEEQKQNEEISKENKNLKKDNEEKIALIEHIKDLLRKQTKYLSNNAKEQNSIKEEIIECAAKTNKFLQENGAGLAEDVSLYDAINTELSPLEFNNAVTNLFEKYSDIQTNEGEDLLITLSQSISVISVLRKYCEEAKTQISHLTAELNRVRLELNSTLADSQRRIAEMKKSNEEEIAKIKEETVNGEEILRSTENILRANITNEELLKPILLAFDNIRSGNVAYELDINEYNDALAETLHKTIIENAGKDEEIKTLKEKDAQETTEIKEAANALEHETTQLIQDQQESINKFIAELETANNKIAEIQAKLEETEEKCKEINREKEELSEKLEESNSKINELEEVINDLNKVSKDKYKAKFQNTLQTVVAEHQKSIEKLQKKVRAVQRENKKAIEEKMQEIEALKQQVNDAFEARDEVIAICSQKDDETKNIVNQYKERVKELENTISAITLDTKVLQQRIKSTEERANREKDNAEALFKVKEMKKDDEIRTRTTKIAEELEKRKQRFMFKIADELHEYFDSSSPITEDSIVIALRKLYADLKLSLRNANKMDDVESQIREIRVILKASKGTRTTTCVKDLVNTVAILREKNAELEKRVKEM